MNKNPLLKLILIVVLFSVCIALPSYAQSPKDIEKQYNQAEKLFQNKQYTEAIKLFEETLEFEKEAYGKDDQKVATDLNNLANLYSDLGEYAKAEFLFIRSLEIREKTYGKDHPDVALALNNLAMLYKDLGDYSKAEPLCKRSLAIWEKTYGKDHPDVALALNNLAGLYDDLGDYSKAEPLYKRSLAIWEKTYGKDHPDVATCLNNLAMLYSKLGNYSKAEPLYKRSLAIWEKTYGKDHPDVALALNNLAMLYRNLGNYSKAEPLYKRSLAIWEKTYGKDHPDVATCLNNLAGLYNDLGNYSKAEFLYKRSLEIREKTYGKDHPEVALALNNLAMLYSKLGNYSKAEPLYKRSLEIKEKTFGKDHPEVALALNNLAMLYNDLGDYSKAEPLYKRSLAIWEKTYGKDHPDVALALNNLASLYISLGDYSRTESLYKRSLAIYEKTYGKDHPDVATCLNNLAILYSNLGNYSKAEPLHKRSLAIDEKTYGKDHPKVAQALNNLAGLYKDLGDYSKAEPLYKRSLAIWKKTYGKDHPDVALALDNMAGLYIENGRLDKAYEWIKGQKDSMLLGKYYLVKKEYLEAEKQFQASLDNIQKKEVKIPRWLITDHIGLGLSFEGQAKYGAAKVNFQKAIDLIEEKWKTLNVSARRNFMSGTVGAGFKRTDPYEGMVRALLNEGNTGCEKESLKYAEMVKSRLFLEQLAARSFEGKTGEDSEALAKDREFQRKIAYLRTRLAKLNELGIRAPKGDKENVSKEIDKISSEYETFLNEVKLSGSEILSLMTVDTVKTDNLQKLIGPDTTLLEYYTAKDSTYAWLITQETIKAFVINKGEKEIGQKVNDFRLANISNKTRRPSPVMTLSSGTQKEATKVERENNRLKYAKLSKEFYKTLISPLEDRLNTDKLIIVPHGALHKVPFSSLNDGEKYMIDRYSISVLPASSVMKYIEKKRNKDNGKLLALSNPKTEFLSLKYAEAEVKAISGFFNKKEIYERDNATESVTKKKVSEADILHFACHGEFNDTQPLQSGLLLAKDSDNDGYLQVHEIFGLDLAEANLVTLSACETALSKIQGGDDLVGLSRGFIYAGTPSLLATLWQVDDRAVSELMKKFYKNWQVKGMSKPEALRQAQLSIKKIPKYSDPFYWAPFEMIGDWQ